MFKYQGITRGCPRTVAVPILLAVFLLILACPPASPASLGKAPGTGDKLTISGVMEDAQGNGIKGVEIELALNGRKVPALGQGGRLESGGQGAFVGRYRLPRGTLPVASLRIRVVKPGWQAQESGALRVLQAGTDAAGDRLFQVGASLTLKRQITAGFWIATLVLLLVFLAIYCDWMHRALISCLGAALIIFITHTLGTWNQSFYIISFDDAVGAIDLNVIFLLLGMMLFMGVLKKTGLFQYLAYKAYARARGNVFVLSLALQVITAVISAFLNNVTTMILMVPVTIEIAVTLKINPLTLLIPEVFASNIGGTATLIGDPPNILIGSYAGLTFGQFVRNLTLVTVVALMASSCYFLWWYKKDYLKADVSDVDRTVEFLKEEYQITDKKLMTLGLLLLAVTVLFFILSGILKLPVAVPALAGSLLLLAISGEDIAEMLQKEVEWPTLLFLAGLFVIIAGAEETGLIQVIANFLMEVSKGNLTAAMIIILWGSAVASAFIANIPFAATMLPIVAFLNQTIPGAESGVLWWALALGACLGGNGTMVGASANMVAVGLAEQAGYRITFGEYLKACWWPMMITVTICMIYLLIAY